MSRLRASRRRMLLGCALWLFAAPIAQAGTYLVCYVPSDAGKRLIRFCPGVSGASPGEPCQCRLRTETLTGTMSAISIPDGGAVSGEAAPTMCVAQGKSATTLCPAYRSTGETACICDGVDGQPGATNTVSMLTRIPLRTNQAAAADFLKRLQECCVSR
jgi:hypothetical protein